MLVVNFLKNCGEDPCTYSNGQNKKISAETLIFGPFCFVNEPKLKIDGQVRALHLEGSNFF